MMNNEVEEYVFEDDADFEDLVPLLALPRPRRISHPRIDHFTWWRDNEFYDLFRLSKIAVRYVIDFIGARISYRTDRDRTVSVEDKVLLTLRYYATGSILVVCGNFNGIHKSTASRIIRLVSHTIAKLRSQFIRFPRKKNGLQAVEREFFNIAQFPIVIGALACTHIKIELPGGNDDEAYRNRKGFFSINVQTICDANLKIQDIVAKWPGSTHNSVIFNNSAIREKFERTKLKNWLLVADSGYENHKFIMTLVGNHRKLLDPALGITAAGIDKYNESLIRTRNPVEKCYSTWKRRFPILATGINVKISPSESIIVATAVLHNIACDFNERVPEVTSEIESTIQTADRSSETNPRDNVGRISVNNNRNHLVQYFQNRFIHNI